MYRQPLNCLDRFELDVHDVFRLAGHPGLKLQLHLWFRRSMDPDVLQAAVDRLVRRFPVAASRLDRSAKSWVASPGQTCTVELLPLATDRDEEVWDHAATLLSRVSNPEQEPPVSFHLLRRPRAGDALLLQWNHAAMDGKAGELLLQELNRLHLDPSVPLEATPPLTEDEPRARIRATSLRQRLRVLIHLRRDRTSSPPTLMISDADRSRWLPGPIRLAGRTLSEETTSALVRRSQELCGFSNLTALLCAGTYRAFADSLTDPPGPDAIYQAPVPINLRPPGARAPIFSNRMAYIRLRVTHSELDDRDELIRKINQRMREKITQRADLGSLMAMSIGASSRRLQRRVARRPAARISLGYAYLGEMPAELETFCGVEVDRQFFLTTLPSPPGLGVSMSICRGRLNISMTYVDSAIPRERAEAFLERVVSDLQGAAGKELGRQPAAVGAER